MGVRYMCIRGLPFAASVLSLAAFAQPATAPFTFTTGAPTNAIATGSQPSGPEIESADDFVVGADRTTITSAKFYGLIPNGAPLSSVTRVVVELYRVFPLDSVSPPSGNVPTRANSPSDNAFDSRDSAAGALTFTVQLVSPSFTASNSVLNGINKIPGQTTGGEGPVARQEVLITATFTQPFNLPADHYFFVPQVQVSGGNFLWLSAARPNVINPFSPDLQAWIRNAALDPDWLRIGTDIVGGSPAPTFNLAFELNGFITISEDVYQVRYAGNLIAGDSFINLTNAGTLSGSDPAGRICVNVYTFDPAEELVSCCACPITPNGLASLSVREDLISNTLTPGVPTSVTIKLLSSLPVAGSCDAASPNSTNLVRGMRAWGTTLHAVTADTRGPRLNVTETPFLKAELSASELAKLSSFCGFIKAIGSGFGICRSCRFGALGGAQR